MPILLLSFIVSFVTAESSIAEYGTANADNNTTIKIVHPSSTSSSSAISQSFNATGTYYLTKIDVYLQKYGSPVANVKMALYSHSGTYGSTSTPNTLLETSTTTFDISTLPTATFSQTSFTFARTTQLTAGTKYCLVIYADSSTTLDSTNFLRIQTDSSTPTYSGNPSWYRSSAYTAQTTFDIIFYVYGEADLEPTPTPTATPTPAPTNNPIYNQAPFPIGWYSDNPWGHEMPDLNVFRDITVTHDGSYTLRIDSTAETNSAFDYWKINIHPNDQILMSCWIKTDGANLNSYSGARLGFDIYDSYNVDLHGYTMGHWAPTECSFTTDRQGVNYDGYVIYGQDWTQVTWQFNIPTTISCLNQGFPDYPYADGTLKTPAFIVPWCQNWPNNYASVWFSDMQIYVNPSIQPTPAPTVTGSPAPTPTTYYSLPHPNEDFQQLPTVNNTDINPLYFLLGLAGGGLVLYQVVKAKKNE